MSSSGFDPVAGPDARVLIVTVRERLIEGITRRHGDVPVVYRLLRPTDDVAAITTLLHRAYAPLARAGLRYFASHQTPDDTRRRLSRGDAVVALVGSTIIGTVTLSRVDATQGCAFYDRPDVASFGQFAVAPEHHRLGIGSALMGLVEAMAVERGVAQLALDTAAGAAALLAFYERRGFQVVDRIQWSAVNYPSVVLARPPQMPVSFPSPQGVR